MGNYTSKKRPCRRRSASPHTSQKRSKELVKEVLTRVKKRVQFRGIVSEVITEALELWVQKKANREK